MRCDVLGFRGRNLLHDFLLQLEQAPLYDVISHETLRQNTTSQLVGTKTLIFFRKSQSVDLHGCVYYFFVPWGEEVVIIPFHSLVC